LRRAEACLGPMEALCRAFPRGQNLQPMSSSDHFPARNRLPPKSVRIQGLCAMANSRRGLEAGLAGLKAAQSPSPFLMGRGLSQVSAFRVDNLTDF